MSPTLIRANTQIMPATITAALFVASLGLATSQLAEGALFLKKDGSVPMTGSLNLGGNTLTNVGTGVNPGDGVNFAQLAAIANGYGTKGGSDAAVLTNVASKSGLGAQGGITPTDGDVISLFGQTTGSENGPWVAHSSTWTRPAWYTGSVVSEGALIVIERGTYAGYSFILSTQGAITVDTTATTWVTVPTATTPTAGNGIAISGNQFSVKNGNGLTFDGSQNLILNLVGASLSLTASGLKIADAASAGQVMLGGTANAATFTTLGGEIKTVTSAGVVTLADAVRRSSSFVYNEALGGTMNGSNANFTLASTPVSGTVTIYYNTTLLFPGSGNDYTISSGTITMATPPLAGDRLVAHYQV